MSSTDNGVAGAKPRWSGRWHSTGAASCWTFGRCSRRRGILEALSLDGAGGDNALADGCGGLAGRALTELVEGHGLYLALDVDAVESFIILLGIHPIFLFIYCCIGGYSLN